MKINFTNFPKEFKFLKNDLIKKFIKLGKSAEDFWGNE